MVIRTQKPEATGAILVDELIDGRRDVRWGHDLIVTCANAAASRRVYFDLDKNGLTFYLPR
jgi:hypothetical protein